MNAMASKISQITTFQLYFVFTFVVTTILGKKDRSVQNTFLISALIEIVNENRRKTQNQKVEPRHKLPLW